MRQTLPRRLARFSGARLNNVAVVPASLLGQQFLWQAVANNLPAGDVLLVLPAGAIVAKSFVQRLSASVESHGHHVTTLPIDYIA